MASAHRSRVGVDGDASSDGSNAYGPGPWPAAGGGTGGHGHMYSGSLDSFVDPREFEVQHGPETLIARVRTVRLYP